ncbi:MAG: translation initiation factor IF-3 [Desulfobacteraceae bacterium]|nr:translation initiation factor IF-3 [Desulfobacteraceae bacterium]MCB9494108.1 translation initiation factor IF-3 [Desulfobacteraceae bacterium]
MAVKKTEQTRVNDQIKEKEVRVIDSEGNQLGVLSINDAINAAEEAGLDLVEVSPGASPPVCRIMDFGRFKYQQTKKKQEAKKKQAVVQVKEIKVRPKTEDHDLNTKLRQIRGFLTKNNKVKITVRFRGREITLPEMGKDILARIAAETEDIASIETRPKFEGRTMIMVLAPKKE